ncbi:MAG: glycerol-3-phosphate 1-O-acyltransferase PlsY [Oscillospiraceae bacterium]|nr:glycerol-3-phosphate 1-O-acyltransferase PlsY [Oscillospiraceae bacterium]
MTDNFIYGIIATIIISYLLGSINSSIVVCRVFKGTDIRTVGSKNAGLTNTIRCFGKGLGLLTLIGDLAKGVVAVLISKALFAYFDMGLDGLKIVENPPENGTVFVGYIAGFFAIIGHILPVYYGFKGGKGVLTASSILLVVDIRTFAIIIPFFLIVSFATRYVSIGSITAAVFYPILTFAVQYYWRDFTFTAAMLDTILVVFTSALLIYMHRGNIKRLKQGTENKIKLKKA